MRGVIFRGNKGNGSIMVTNGAVESKDFVMAEEFGEIGNIRFYCCYDRSQCIPFEKLIYRIPIRSPAIDIMLIIALSNEVLKVNMVDIRGRDLLVMLGARTKTKLIEPELSGLLILE